MRTITTLLLVVLTLICVYIIMNVGLGWFWAVGYCDNSERVNQVLINLSYSYLAGLIFYLLVTYLPYIMRKAKLLPAIRLKMRDLNYQVNACIQTFETQDNPNLVDTITPERLTQLINGSNMYGQSFYATQIGIGQDNLDFLVRTRAQIFDLIEQILSYKDYLTEEQIIDLEKIHDSRYFNLVSVYQNTPCTQHLFSSVQFKEGVIEELFQVITDLRHLKESFV